MMHVVRAEWLKLMHRGMVVMGGGGLVGLAALGTLLVFSQAQDAPSPTGPGFTTAVLQQPDGLVQSLALTSQIVGAVSLVLFARAVTNEYAHGTLKVALTREPRRGALLAGKFLAMGAFVSVAGLVAVMAALGVGSAVAAARGMDVAAWWGSEGLSDLGLGVLRFEAALLVWGLFGFALGAVFRSGAAATGLGVSVIFVGGHLLERFWADAGEWLPNLVLSTFTVGGTELLSLGAATLVVGLYAVVLAGTSLLAFTRGDVAA